MQTRPDLFGLLRGWEPPVKLHARRRLENAALLSSVRATHARSERARQRFWQINEAANAWMTAQVDNDELCDVANAFVRELLSAGLFERLEGAA